MRHGLLVLTLFASASTAHAAEGVTLTGRIFDIGGKALENATVLVYQARVKHGYSTYCPTCYVDCGKRALTGADGSFTIKSLDPDLFFDLLVVRDGYASKFVNRVDPSAGQPSAALVERPRVDDPARLARGRVVDPRGEPLRAAVIMPIGLSKMTTRGEMSTYGTVDGLEPVAVTNVKGEFEVAYAERAKGMLLQVEARGMATKLIAIPTGAEPTTIAVSPGATVRGRLLENGKPVAGAEIGLIPRDRGGYGGNLKLIGNPYSEIRIGTQEDGSFVISNVPAPVEWYVYAKMESIAARGASVPVEVATARDGAEVNAGNLEIRAGHRLRGKIALSDGAVIAEGMRVTISARQAWDSQTVVAGPGGSFEFDNLPSGQFEIFPSVRGYRLTNEQRVIEATVDRDIDDFSIVVEPAARR